MMYTLRGIVATLSVLAMSYVVLSLIIVLCWRLVMRLLPSGTSVSAARRLYALRIAPLTVAAVIALGFELPSYLFFEPRIADEVLSAIPLGLSLAVLAFVAVGVWHGAAACARTSELCRRWTAKLSGTVQEGVVVCETNASGPPVAVLGIRSPRLLLSPELEHVLNSEELARAVAHETAHVKHHDNLRKLTMQLCRFPGMASLEQAWAEAVEFAADERAVSSRREALALASALIKVSGMSLPPLDPHLLVTNFVGHPGSTARRVQRLSQWRDFTPSREKFGWVSFVVMGAASTGIFLSYGAILAHLHYLTEALFR